MLPTLNIGPLAIPTAPVILLLGLWLGLSQAERHAPKAHVDPGNLYNLVVLALVSALAGARLAYVLRYPAVFFSSPLDIFSRSGLLDPWGAAAAGTLAALAYGQRKKMPLWPSLDALTSFAAVMMVAVAISHIASGAAFGAPSQAPWSIDLWGERRHPTQVYEAIAALGILLLTWPGISPFHHLAPGQRFLVFLALTAAARLFLEAFRGDSTLIFGGLRLAQVLAWGVLASCLWAFNRLQTA